MIRKSQFGCNRSILNEVEKPWSEWKKAQKRRKRWMICAHSQSSYPLTCFLLLLLLLLLGHIIIIIAVVVVRTLFVHLQLKLTQLDKTFEKHRVFPYHDWKTVVPHLQPLLTSGLLWRPEVRFRARREDLSGGRAGSEGTPPSGLWHLWLLLLLLEPFVWFSRNGSQFLFVVNFWALHCQLQRNIKTYKAGSFL